MIPGLTVIKTNGRHGSKRCKATKRLGLAQNGVFASVSVNYKCMYLSELWSFGVLDQANNLAFLVK